MDNTKFFVCKNCGAEYEAIEKKEKNGGNRKNGTSE